MAAFKKELTEVSSEPNVVPMADIMLVLLIIFMVVTPMLQKGTSVDLAITNNARNMTDADKEDAILVAVTRDGKVFLGTDQVGTGLTEQIQELISVKVDKTVYIKSDARTRYEQVVSVIEQVRAAGVDQLGLITERREGGAAQMPAPTL